MKIRASFLACVLSSLVSGCSSPAETSLVTKSDPKTTSVPASKPTAEKPFSGIKLFATVAQLIGQPVGLSELTEEKAKGMAHYRFTYKEGKVTTVEKFLLKDLVLETWQYNQPNANDITVNNEYGVLREVYDFEEDGKSYEKVLRSGKRDNRGCYRLRPELDEKELTVSETCLARKGREQTDKNGVAKLTYERNDQGAITSETNQDLSSAPVVSALGYQKITYELDPLGNRTLTKALDVGGKLVINKETGCAIQDSEYDEKNLEVAKTCYDTGNRPVSDQKGVTRYRYTKNERGCNKEIQYVGADDQALPIKSGEAVVRYEVDEKCGITKEQTFGKDSKQIGPTKVSVRNAEGLATSVKYFNDKEKPAKGDDCEAYEYRYAYDSRGLNTEQNYFDATGKPFMCVGDQRTWAVRKYEYDERGNQTSKSSFMADGQKRRSGWYRIERSYDQDDKKVEAHLLGNPELFNVYSYSADGKPLSSEYLNAKRSPTDVLIDEIGIDDPLGAYQKVTRLYHETGRHTYDVYTKASGKEIARVDCSLKKCFEDAW